MNVFFIDIILGYAGAVSLFLNQRPEADFYSCILT
jgi:hypothetical protein